MPRKSDEELSGLLGVLTQHYTEEFGSPATLQVALRAALTKLDCENKERFIRNRVGHLDPESIIRLHKLVCASDETLKTDTALESAIRAPGKRGRPAGQKGKR